MDTLQLGVAQLQGESSLPAERTRRPGGGRKPITEIYPDLVPSLLNLVEEDTQGDPESPLLWKVPSFDPVGKLFQMASAPGATAPVIGAVDKRLGIANDDIDPVKHFVRLGVSTLGDLVLRLVLGGCNNRELPVEGDPSRVLIETLILALGATCAR